MQEEDVIEWCLISTEWWEGGCLGKVCKTPSTTDEEVAGWSCGAITSDQCIAGHEFGACGGLKPHRRRTHPRAPRSCRRTIHKLLSANSIVSRAMFLARPR